jgi:thiol-disulfide isomerase/thioredoxin
MRKGNRIMVEGFGRRACVLLTALLSLALPCVRSSAQTVKSTTGVAPAPGRWKDVEGHDYDVAQIAHNKATVFIFASTECPISNIYMPRLSDMARAFKDRGVRFLMIDSNREDSPDALRRYERDRKLPFPVIRDTGTTLADWLSATATPEAVVLDPRGEVCYRGRIDDNQDRARVIHNDLREALNALLEGKPVARPRTLTFGCAIFRDTAQPVAAATGPKVTYARDVAPILDRNCLVCHRTGETAPFALETYQQARTWAAAIRDYTARRLMPPWKAVPGYGDFHDARTLSAAEIDTLARWTAAGAPQGDPKDRPTLPTFPDAQTWSLGKPDQVLQPVRPYHLAAEGPDVYRNFVLPADFTEDRYVSAMEFKPGNRAVVHHVVLYIDPSGKSADMDGKEAEPGYTVPGTGIGLLGAEWGEVWVPGRTPRFMPDGVAVKIPRGAKLVMQVHYHKNGAVQADSTQVALYYAKGRVDQVMQGAPLINPTFVLKPGNRAQSVALRIKLPTDVHLRTIFPHMHLLGREMRVTATLPDGSKKALIYVKDWDFNWQETYVYKDPVALPKGAIISIEAVYDNSETNPRQTNHPAKEVRWGEQTTDEMCVCVLGITLDSEKLGLELDSNYSGI